MKETGEEPSIMHSFPKFYLENKTSEGEKVDIHNMMSISCVFSQWGEVSLSQVKKVKKIWIREKYKQEKTDERLVSLKHK